MFTVLLNSWCITSGFEQWWEKDNKYLLLTEIEVCTLSHDWTSFFPARKTEAKLVVSKSLVDTVKHPDLNVRSLLKIFSSEKQTLIVISIYFIFSLQLCGKLKIYSPMVMLSEVTFKKAAGDWPIAKVKVCLVLIDMEALLHSYTKNYTYEAVG